MEKLKTFGEFEITYSKEKLEGWTIKIKSDGKIYGLVDLGLNY